MPQTQIDHSGHVGKPAVDRVLPRLLYVGDVPVECSSHGSALLYRLLETYPADRLFILETVSRESLPARRLRHVPYGRFNIGGTRWLNTRFTRWVGSAFTFRAPGRARLLDQSLAGFAPEAVLTVAHGFSWLAAAQFAATAKLPLHLIVHDDYPMTTVVLPALKQWQEQKFARVYRQAVSRLCVSPAMEAEYRRRYGVAGQTMYPSRARAVPSYDDNPATYSRESGPLIGAYAGNLFYPEFASLIGTMAERLGRSGGKVLLFGPHSPENLSALSLNRPNILPQGMVDSEQLIRRLRKEADFVFVPMAFDSGYLDCNTRLSFPSKLTDYTATGLPILINGPEHCSAVQWARDFSPVAEVVTTKSPEQFDAALDRLTSFSYRESLGTAALAVGDRLFSQDAAFEILKCSLLSE